MVDEDVNIDIAIETTVNKLSIPVLKAEQYVLLKAVIQGKDGFSVLPLGFDKSLMKRWVETGLLLWSCLPS